VHGAKSYVFSRFSVDFPCGVRIMCVLGIFDSHWVIKVTRKGHLRVVCVVGKFTGRSFFLFSRKVAAIYILEVSLGSWVWYNEAQGDSSFSMNQTDIEIHGISCDRYTDPFGQSDIHTLSSKPSHPTRTALCSTHTRTSPFLFWPWNGSTKRSQYIQSLLQLTLPFSTRPFQLTSHEFSDSWSCRNGGLLVQKGNTRS